MLGNIPKLDVISKEWNVYTYFIRMLWMLVISKGFHTKSWSAKVNIVFICEINFMKRTPCSKHAIQFIRLPVFREFYFYDKIFGSIIYTMKLPENCFINYCIYCNTKYFCYWYFVYVFLKSIFHFFAKRVPFWLIIGYYKIKMRKHCKSFLVVPVFVEINVL